MGNRLKPKEREYFFTQHVRRLKNLLQRRASDGYLWIGKDVGAFNTAFLVPQTPRALMCLLTMTAEEGVSEIPTSRGDWMGSEAPFLCRVTYWLYHNIPPRSGEGSEALTPASPDSGRLLSWLLPGQHCRSHLD